MSNSPPQASIWVRSSTLLTGENVTVFAEGNDRDGVIETGQWDLDGDGRFEWSKRPESVIPNSTEGAGADTTFVFAPLDRSYATPGNYTLQFRCFDDAGDWSGATANVTVVNRAPTLRAVVHPRVIRTGDTVTITIDAADADGTVVWYGWDLDGDGEYDRTSEERGQTTHRYDRAANYTVHIAVEDNDGAISTGTETIRVRNRPPTVTIEPLAEGSRIVVGRRATVAAVASDPDGTIEHWYWDFDGDGVYDSDADDGARATAQWTYEDTKVYELRVVVEDDAGSRAEDTLLVTVEAVDSEEKEPSPAIPDRMMSGPFVLLVAACGGVLALLAAIVLYRRRMRH